jgi:protocatechuate 3,4-dioxygenase beta subunit
MADSERKRVGRREVLAVLGAGIGAALAGCGSSPTSPSSNGSSGSSGTTGGTSAAGCATTASETAGPYPDKLGMFNNAAFYRRDITEGRPGTPLTVVLTVVSADNGCAPVANATVEMWHCDAAGDYSEYSQPGFNGAGQTFLRGLQTTGANGQVTFTTIYPGWYAGRATHIHIEVFVNGASVKTTQMAFPESTSASVYITGVYASRGQNPTSNAADGIFSDGISTELATLETMTGSAASGFTATLTIGV